VASYYWSSTQTSATGAWYVVFGNAGAGSLLKPNSVYVRCALGQYW
jgi:hypothetical protein